MAHTRRRAQAKGDRWGAKVVLPHERKSELDVVVFLPDEFHAASEAEAKELGSLAALHRVAGLRPAIFLFLRFSANFPFGWGLK